MRWGLIRWGAIFSRGSSSERVSFSTALAVVAIAGSIGIALGLAAGYLGGKWETVIMRFVDRTILAFPGLLLAIVVLSMVGPSQLTLILVLSALGWMVYTQRDA